MKCSLKDGFINILLIIFIVPSEEVEIPLLLQTSLVLDKPMNFKQFKAVINKLQDLDSFPDADDSKNKLHRIVKKQMATSDGKDLKRNKKSVLSVFNLPESFDRSPGDGTQMKSKDDGKTKKEVNGFESSKPSRYFSTKQRHDNELSKEFLGQLKDFSKDKQINKKVLIKENKKKRSLYDYAPAFNSLTIISDKAKEKKASIKPLSTEKAVKKKNCPKLEGHNLIMKEKFYAKRGIKERQKFSPIEGKGKQKPARIKEEDLEKNIILRNQYTRLPDENDYRYYYEYETKPFGCTKLTHKRCPDGEFFSNKYLRCLKADSKDIKKMKRLASCPSPKKADIFDNSEDPEPANEWLDANQGPIQKIPPEFKPKKIPQLKIYHLCSKIKKKEAPQKINKKRHAVKNIDSTYVQIKKNLVDVTKGMVKRLGKRQHHPRSFLIRIKKKEGKENQDQSITENDEDEDENDEEYDEEDGEDEDEETEEETQENAEEEKEEEKPSYKDGLKEFFKSAKAAVTNRARFDDPTRPEPNVHQKDISSLKSKKFEDSGDSENKSKKVLVDANIRVDSTIGNALKYILKSKLKGNKDSHFNLINNDEALICDRGSQDQMDPELLRMYEHLIRNNPRVKRYFLANCAKKGN